MTDRHTAHEDGLEFGEARIAEHPLPLNDPFHKELTGAKTVTKDFFLISSGSFEIETPAGVQNCNTFYFKHPTMVVINPPPALWDMYHQEIGKKFEVEYATHPDGYAILKSMVLV